MFEWVLKTPLFIVHVLKISIFYGSFSSFKGMLTQNIEHFLQKRIYEKLGIFWNELTKKLFR